MDKNRKPKIPTNIATPSIFFGLVPVAAALGPLPSGLLMLLNIAVELSK